MHILNLSSCDLGYHSSSHGSMGSIVARATSANSSSSTLSSCDTYLIRSVTLKHALLNSSIGYIKLYRISLIYRLINHIANCLEDFRID